ncbi:hypothetical protein F4780DRAFT_222649 [Xylariomycetidae sp. FL0641]|nr:hypothetical protein F4780DRAFT_222649 [Xylariomycetidae sp. FL0641]
MQLQSCLLAMLSAGSAMAHMNMKDPPPLEYKNNPNAQQPDIDYSITSPITGAQYPCKGYLDLLGTPEGASVQTYAPGEQSTMSVEGGASHNGGSCQLSLSYDSGKSFTVIKSFIGNCPTSSGGTFDFKIPDDAPEGDDVVFAWTWVNNTGNREFYMSCAVVSIKGSSAKRDISERASVAFADRPQVFQANLGGEYCTTEGVDTVFPNPGPDVENTSSNPGPAIFCDSGEPVPTGAGSDSGSGSAPATTAAPAAPETTAVATSAPSMYVPSSSAPASTSSTPTSAVTSSPAPTSFASSSSGNSTSATSATSAPTPSILTVIPITTTTSSTSTSANKTLTSDSSSSTGGVFFTTVPNGGETPTTMSTATLPATTTAVASTPEATTPVATPSPAPVSSGGEGEKTGACSTEGEWNCIGGSSFQRCASGAWSAVQPMAAGTKCNAGVSNVLQMSRSRRDRVRRNL